MKIKSIYPLMLVTLLTLNSCKDKVETTDTKTIDSVTVEKPVEKPMEEISPELTAVDTVASATKTSKTDDQFEYICYTFDTDANKRIWIQFGSNGKANLVKYQGQKKAIKIVFKSEDFRAGGAHPTVTTKYDELIDGKVNGEYTLIHSGVWDYVSYQSNGSNKVFKFTIDHEADLYGHTPCF